MKDHYKNKDFSLLYACGRPFAPFYSFAMGMRAALYRKEVFRVHRLKVPVVSVGNLTMGGTGKTPMVIYLARLLSEKYKVAVVSRGYGGRARKKVNVISDGRSILLEPPLAADEASLVACRLKNVPVLTGSKRADVGRYAVDRLGAELVVLDDAFQHMALHRDVNIVLFKASTFLGNNRVFPGGDMREPLAALNRANAFVVTCVDEHKRKRVEAYKVALNKKFPDIPVFFGKYRPLCLVTPDNKEIDLDQGNYDFFGFCGLAHPDSFQQTLADLGFRPAGFQAFKDHQHYSRRRVDSLVKKAVAAGGNALITTEKDFVKMKTMTGNFPVLALRMEVGMGEDFDQFVLNKIISPTEA